MAGTCGCLVGLRAFAAQFAIVFIIQTYAFTLTLRRKNLISHQQTVHGACTPQHRPLAFVAYRCQYWRRAVGAVHSWLSPHAPAHSRLSPHALTLAITYFDRYCAEEGSACVNMRAAAAACVCIAAKFVESSCPSFRALTDQCAFGQQQLSVSQIEDAGE